MKNENYKVEWYDNAKIVTSAIIGLIGLIIILSQSFAVNHNLSTANIFRDIINHNINYILVVIYFIALKFSIGKKYFNHLNIYLVVLYGIFTVTSFLSVFQGVNVTNILSLAIKVVLFSYIIHTMFRDTRYFKDLKINKSPFIDIKNDDYYAALVVLGFILLTFNLISITTFDGAIISIMDAIYVFLFGRYIFLYREYLDLKTLVKVREAEKQKEDK